MREPPVGRVPPRRRASARAVAHVPPAPRPRSAPSGRRTCGPCSRCSASRCTTDLADTVTPRCAIALLRPDRPARPGDRVRDGRDDRRDGRRRPRPRLPRRRGAPAGRRRRCSGSVGAAGLTNVRVGARGRARAGPASRCRRVPRRGARVLPRPVAQGAPPQAPARAAVARGAAALPAASSAACCTARPTGSTTPTRCSRCWRPTRSCRTRRTASRARPAHRPVTKFEQRGLDLGHEVRDLVFRRVRVSRPAHRARARA